MCGNVGIINRETKHHEGNKLVNLFKQSLIVDSIRGLDSTGVATVDHGGNISINKKAVASQEFLENKQVNQLIDDYSNVIVCGHNRAATTGSLGDSGAHPFTHGDITLFHNGTLNSWNNIQSSKHFNIDSEAICSSINETGVKDTLEKLDGAYALVWYNSTNQTINFARNKDRPLFFAYTPKTNSVIYASEKGMISWLVEKNKIEIGEIKQLKEGIHLTIPLNKDLEITSEEFKIKPPSYDWTNYYGNHGNYYNNHSNHSENYSKDYKSNKVSIELHPDRHLNGCILEVSINKFEAYKSSNKKHCYGFLMGTYLDFYNNSIDVKISGVSEKEANRLLNKKRFVKITSATSKGYLWSVFLTKKEYHKLDITAENIRADDLTVEAYKSKEEVGGQDGSLGQLEPIKTYVGPRGVLITKDSFNALTKHGCGFCSCDLGVKDELDIIWTGNDEPICLECATDEELV